MKILVIGPVCSKCKTLAQFTEQPSTTRCHRRDQQVTDLKQIMALGVMMTPASGGETARIRVSGKVPSIPEIKAMLQQAAAWSS